MRTFPTATGLRTYLDGLPNDQTVAYVPTMGALHAGHMALITAARDSHDVVVASIFVNPTQFNEASDLDTYPRTPEADADLLQLHGCDALYLPAVEDVYPSDYEDRTSRLDFGPLVAVMEGANRPGHFAGVAQVVYRLLDIVRPTTLVLGQKDYQQVAVIRSMIEQLGVKVDVTVVPTVRERDGLALSSRNRRLNDAERLAAGTINLHLKAVAAGLTAGWDPKELEKTAFREMAHHELLAPEYVSIFDGDTLQPWAADAPVRELVVATAVRCGPVRLIDNFIVRTSF
ncbi:pantoate--beta-alanine ligase [Lewinella sp. 4G2]|uniref:pantoate--beta-alanine ligase n=1 Tax=Lewinella sp. 4G2 TaxID=1803372 RepID=UPI0007B47A81|nr:pantoate--beta-alanine ligase [Lewinella sp. 4G2]OAV46226.1 pantoate--beta-alanine ligase [Lewinella sp. 4G2]